ncbi:MAG: MFS transporter [Acidobacteriales bacterium]|nr:MFS transporter [Terriglobales bacterium]
MNACAGANRGKLSGAAYAGMFVFGIVMALVGAALPALAKQFQVGVADVGALLLAMNLTMLVCSLWIGVAIDHFGTKPPLVIGPLLVASALVLIANATRFAHMIPAVVLLGAGGSALNTATNNLVADLYEDPGRKGAALNMLGVFCGIGALFLPLCLGALLTAVGIQWLLIAAAALGVLTAVFAASPSYPVPKQQNRLPIADMPRFLRSPLVLLMAGLLFFQSGVEFIMGGYVSVYLTRGFGMSIPAASWVLAGYWAAILVARLMWSRVLTGARPVHVVIGCALMAAAAAAFTAVAPHPALAGVGICLTGLALSGIFPTTLGVAGAAFQDHSGTVFGILFTGALTGGTLLPWLAGRIAALAGLGWVFGVVALAFVSIAILGAAMRKTQI